MSVGGGKRWSCSSKAAPALAADGSWLRRDAELDARLVGSSGAHALRDTRAMTSFVR
ncbi:hypothetical protein OH799_34495 [Nocardia sp. NBC_00881]|uniref:hypothetical protein n=1 Tax=Nocardia sp. NBC_00881 TaxID=2975995 RepID=UPI003867D208|nr:hypothetical protein OH799_34495 [Nocardia sp. NBC_00881]